MNILVIGCSLLGQKIARTLDGMGWDVSVLDGSESALEQLGEDFGGVLFRGHPMDLRSLRQAGVESCQAVALATENDNMNIAVAQLARDYFHISNVVACVSDPERESAFENLGLRTVCPTNLAGDALVSAVIDDAPAAELKFGMHKVQFVTRPADKYQIGRMVAELRGYPGEKILGLIRKNGAFLLSSIDEVMPENGDSIVYAKTVD